MQGIHQLYIYLGRTNNHVLIHFPYCSRCSVVGSLGVIHMGLGVVSLMEKLGLESRVNNILKRAFINVIVVIQGDHIWRK